MKPYYETELGKLYHGDCLEIMPLLEPVDMILCDLPYGTTACKWDTVIPFEPLWVQYKRLIKDNGAIVLTASQPFTSALVMSNPKWFKYCWVWEKDKPSNFALANKQPMKYHEDICVFYSKHPIYFPIMWEGDKPVHKSAKYGRTPTAITGGGLVGNKQAGGGTRRYPKSILRVNVVNNQSLEKTTHSTQKPVALFEYLIKTYTNEGDTVLDNCAGSGTTAIACMKTNRKYVMVEQEEKYCEIAAKRIENERKQRKLF